MELGRLSFGFEDFGLYKLVLPPFERSTTWKRVPNNLLLVLVVVGGGFLIRMAWKNSW